MDQPKTPLKILSTQERQHLGMVGCINVLSNLFGKPFTKARLLPSGLPKASRQGEIKRRFNAKQGEANYESKHGNVDRRTQPAYDAQDSGGQLKELRQLHEFLNVKQEPFVMQDLVQHKIKESLKSFSDANNGASLQRHHNVAQQSKLSNSLRKIKGNEGTRSSHQISRCLTHTKAAWHLGNARSNRSQIQSTLAITRKITSPWQRVATKTNIETATQLPTVRSLVLEMAEEALRPTKKGQNEKFAALPNQKMHKATAAFERGLHEKHKCIGYQHVKQQPPSENLRQRQGKLDCGWQSKVFLYDRIFSSFRAKKKVSPSQSVQRKALHLHALSFSKMLPGFSNEISQIHACSNIPNDFEDATLRCRTANPRKGIAHAKTVRDGEEKTSASLNREDQVHEQDLCEANTIVNTTQDYCNGNLKLNIDARIDGKIITGDKLESLALDPNHEISHSRSHEDESGYDLIRSAETIDERNAGAQIIRDIYEQENLSKVRETYKRPGKTIGQESTESSTNGMESLTKECNIMAGEIKRHIHRWRDPPADEDDKLIVEQRVSASVSPPYLSNISEEDGEDQLSDDFQQSSPVSVLECCFEEDESSILETSVAKFEDAKLRLLEKVRRFELLASVDLETCAEEENEDLDRFVRDRMLETICSELSAVETQEAAASPLSPTASSNTAFFERLRKGKRQSCKIFFDCVKEASELAEAIPHPLLATAPHYMHQAGKADMAMPVFVGTLSDSDPIEQNPRNWNNQTSEEVTKEIGEEVESIIYEVLMDELIEDFCTSVCLC